MENMNSTEIIEIVEVEYKVTYGPGKGKYKRPEGLKGLTGRWTKWGGGMGQVYHEEIDDFWNCQSCGQRKPAAISPITTI